MHAQKATLASTEGGPAATDAGTDQGKMKGLDTHATESNEEDASSLRIEANNAGEDGGNVANNARDNACGVAPRPSIVRAKPTTPSKQPRPKLHTSASTTRSTASRNTPPALRRRCLSGA